MRCCSRSRRWASSRSAPRRRRPMSSRSVSRRPTACPGGPSVLDLGGAVGLGQRWPLLGADHGLRAGTSRSPRPCPTRPPTCTSVDRSSVAPQGEPRISRTATSPSTTGASTSSETLVTFTNQPAGGNYGTLKVCKLTADPGLPRPPVQLLASNGGPLVSTEANDAFDDPANWSCRILGTFQVGSIVTVHEAIPAGTEVQFIDSDPATASWTSTRAAVTASTTSGRA